MVTKKFEHVMIDLETTGNRPGCGILSIGAVQFDPHTGDLGATYYKVISRSSCVAAGLFEQEDTMLWWANQTKEAQEVLAHASELNRAMKLRHVLVDFCLFLGGHVEPSSMRLWGCGSDFDNVILAAAYHAIGSGIPWEFRNNRCYRTTKSLAPDLKAVRVGIHHNALDDAITQAVHLAEIYKHLKL